MSANIQERLAALFDKVTDKDIKFSKDMYPMMFEQIYQEYEDVFEEIARIVEASEDKNYAIHEIAEYIPEYAAGRIDMSLPKRKREQVLIDYNMGMVTFFIPFMNYNHIDACQKICEEMICIWNEKFASQIRNATYEQVISGFRQRLCYITTAVCKSLGKSDDCYELKTLREYRDQYLLEEKHGSELVQEYYNTAPTIVKHINQLKNREEVYHEIWTEYLTPCIQFIELNKKEECREVYSCMVRELQKKYLYSYS